MRQKSFLRGILTVFALLLAVMASPISAAAVDTANANRMNVVFVMDESGSMLNTDADSLRYDAMELFLGLATESGNYMGAVAFDDDVILQRDIVGIEGMGDKTALSQAVRSVSSQGDTNIGKAIETAVQMLQDSGNPALPSAIILLSDGNTDLDGDDAALQESYTSRDNAINMARANGYTIYSVCLNANGDADPAELLEISAATGGTSVEVKSADDLKEVFNQFYNIIYSTETIVLGDMVIPESGEVEIPFNIPRIGVEEANIIISTLNPDTSYVLYQPDGIAYTNAELDDMKIVAQTFSVLKIQNPEDGTWRLAVKGIPGDNVKIEMVYNSDLTITQTFNGGADIFLDSDVLIGAQIANRGKVITDESLYQDYPLHVVITDRASGATEEYQMSAGSQQAEYAFYLAEGSAYDVYCYCRIDNLTVTSETEILSAENAVPSATAQPATPPPATPSSAEEDNTLPVADGNPLSMMVLLIGLAVLLLLVLLIVIIVKSRERNKPINGRVMIMPYTEDGTGSPAVCDGTRGRMMLARCMNIRESTGMDLKSTYFIHGDRDSHIYLISRNGYYTDVAPDTRNRKIRLEAEIEVDVSSDIDFKKGIKVTYMPDGMDY